MVCDGDVAINLLLPYQHLPGFNFAIHHETPAQHELRRRIENSKSYKYLRGRFVVDFIQSHPDAEYDLAIWKEKTCQDQDAALQK